MKQIADYFPACGRPPRTDLKPVYTGLEVGCSGVRVEWNGVELGEGEGGRFEVNLEANLSRSLPV